MKKLLLLLFFIPLYSQDYPLRQELFKRVITYQQRMINLVGSHELSSHSDGDSQTCGSTTVSLRDGQFMLKDDQGRTKLLCKDGDHRFLLVNPETRFNLSPDGKKLLLRLGNKLILWNTHRGKSLAVFTGFETRHILDFGVYQNIVSIETLEEDDGKCLELFQIDLKLRHQIRKFFKKRFTSKEERLIYLLYNCLFNDLKVPLTDEEYFTWLGLFNGYDKIKNLCKHWITNL
jgi:hypothetical protein